ncbi:hypothetical protein HOLleu_22970 [Holothuria leucospilota]|uniref:Uncharacterized protein n=1 Tax=Holothuria leucospilota TaxID=206669 RepID=A0A9Q1BU64_HOLLE|nr:hypothetical protein HOLleu_22970 [Holothuria leucospilota]
MTDEEMWAFEESLDGVLYIVELFQSVDEESGCTTVKMTPKDSPRVQTTTYNPYNKVPRTDEFMLAKACLNVNTTGYYEPPPTPTQWKDFNLTVEFFVLSVNMSL